MSSKVPQPFCTTLSELDDPETKPENFPISRTKSWWLQTKSRAKRLWYDTWFLEIFALIISTTCGVGIYATLGSLDGKPLPTMPKTLTLNTIIAFLATVAKSSLILIVSSCIGQLKWKWYQKSRRVRDVQLFDDASRGPLGSFQMLMEHRGMSIACIGALILLLALLFDPFIQQAVDYPILPVLQPSSSAKANQSRVFLAGLDCEYGIPSIAQEALDAGIWSSGFDPKPFCPSSDCAWDTFTSLGLCSSCGPANPSPQLDCNFDPNYSVNRSAIDPNDDDSTDDNDSTFDIRSCLITFRGGRVTKLLNVSFQFYRTPWTNDRTYRIVAPSYGLFEVYTGEKVRGQSHIYSYHDPNLVNDTIQGVENPLLALAAVEFNLTGTNLTIAKAEECTLNFCLRDYSMEITNNAPQVNISNIRNGATTYLDSSENLDSSRILYCWVAQNETLSIDVRNLQNTISDLHHYCPQMPLVPELFLPTAHCGYSGSYVFNPEHFSFCMSKDFGPFHNWGGAISQYLTGNVSQSLIILCSDDFSQCGPTGEHYLLDGSSIKTNPWKNTSVKDSILHMRLFGFDKVMSNIADSITLLNLQQNGTIVEGRAGSSVTHIHVRWAWLALPTSLLGAGALLFLYTIIDAKGHNIRLWKSSALAFLYHGLEARQLELDESKSIEKVSQMEARSTELKVRLMRDHGHGRTIMVKSEGAPRVENPE